MFPSYCRICYKCIGFYIENPLRRICFDCFSVLTDKEKEQLKAAAKEYEDRLERARLYP